MECAWVYAKQQCNCVPWFLKGYYPDARLCNRFQNRCFNHYIENRYELLSDDSCFLGCLPDCEITAYQVAGEHKIEDLYNAQINCENEKALIHKDVRTACEHSSKEEMAGHTMGISPPYIM